MKTGTKALKLIIYCCPKCEHKLTGTSNYCCCSGGIWNFEEEWYWVKFD